VLARVLNEFYRIAFRKKVYRSIDELQVDLDSWIKERPHQGRWCLGKNPDADLPGCDANSEGENDRSLITSNTKTRPLNQASPVEFQLIQIIRTVVLS
jgi:hypothetical protein